MTDRNKKEQLGARVTPGVRQRCIDAAARVSLSLNLWVEQALLEKLRVQDEKNGNEPMILEGQTTVDDFVGADTVTGVRAAPTKPFAPDCSMGAYHWRCSPGNPCKRCGGEA